jgi:hypothetical protein
MPTEFKKLPDEPIVIVTLPTDYNLAVELPKIMPVYMNFLNSATTPVFWIVDARNSPLGVEEIVRGAELVARGEHPLYHHPNIRKVIYVTSNKIMKLAVAGMENEIFGNLTIKVFDDLDEALKFVRTSN